MAVERASTLEPLEEQEYAINKDTLVVGGGAAGMTAALSLANQGFKATLVEKSDQLGGNLRKVKHLLDGTEIEPFLSGLIESVEQHPRIEVSRNTEIVTVSVIQGFGFGLVFVPLSTVAFLTLSNELRTDGTAMLTLMRLCAG